MILLFDLLEIEKVFSWRDRFLHSHTCLVLPENDKSEQNGGIELIHFQEPVP